MGTKHLQCEDNGYDWLGVYDRIHLAKGMTQYQSLAAK
jgi:hypothetical protein